MSVNILLREPSFAFPPITNNKFEYTFILRNNHGKWLKGFACFLRRGNSLLVEFWAIFLGIVLAREENFDPIIVESDCLTVVSLLNSKQAASSHHYASIINLCRSKLTEFSDFKVVHVVREGKKAVDKVAVFARNSRTDYVIFDFMPAFLSAFALADCIDLDYPRFVGVG